MHVPYLVDVRVLMISIPGNRPRFQDIEKLFQNRSVSEIQKTKGSTYPIASDILAAHMDPEYPSDHDIRVTNKMRAKHVIAMRLIRDSNNRMDAALEGYRGISNTGGAYEHRFRFRDVPFFKLVAPGLEGGRVDIVAQSVGRHVPDELVGLDAVHDGVF